VSSKAVRALSAEPHSIRWPLKLKVIIDYIRIKAVELYFD
jgi:hypothetical protein